MPRRTPIDDHGQPVSRAFCAARIADRGMDELIGLCKGIIADGHVHQREAEFMMRWIEANEHVAQEWPANVIAARVHEALRDGNLDGEESRDLLELLRDVTGEKELAHLAENKSMALLDTPARVDFPGRSFCFTGKFIFGPRKICESEVEAAGGAVAKIITQQLDYLVVGLLGSRDWMHSTHGRKVEQAVKLRDAGHPVRVIGEDIWSDWLAR